MMGYGTVSAESTKGCPLKAFPGLSKANGLFVSKLLFVTTRSPSVPPESSSNHATPWAKLNGAGAVELDVPCPPATIP